LNSLLSANYIQCFKNFCTYLFKVLDLYNFILLAQHPFTKKFSILFVLLTGCNNIFIHIIQGNWRWRATDSLKTAAAWKPDENIPVTLTSTDDISSLQYEFRTVNDASYYCISENLQYASSTSGPWTTIGITAGSNAFVLVNADKTIAQNDKTTKRLCVAAHDVVVGKILTNADDATPGTSRECGTSFKWLIGGTSNVSGGTSYYFKCYSSGTN
jgi:hypothetical protein